MKTRSVFSKPDCKLNGITAVSLFMGYPQKTYNQRASYTTCSAIAWGNWAEFVISQPSRKATLTLDKKIYPPSALVASIDSDGKRNQRPAIFIVLFHRSDF
jgi:hypothetical protein